MGILHRAKFFLGTPELQFTYKAFIRSLMEYCSPLWADCPASHLAQPDAMETKVFNINGISHDEAESMGLSLHHRRQFGVFFVFFRIISDLAPSALSVLSPHVSAGCRWSTSTPSQ